MTPTPLIAITKVAVGDVAQRIYRFNTVVQLAAVFAVGAGVKA